MLEKALSWIITNLSDDFWSKVDYRHCVHVILMLQSTNADLWIHIRTKLEWKWDQYEIGTEHSLIHCLETLSSSLYGAKTSFHGSQQ